MDVRRPAVIIAVAALGLVGAGSPPGGPRRAALLPERIVVLHPAEQLGAVVAAAGDVWVDDRARQRLLRVDGASGRVRAEVAVDGRIALASAPHAVWALQSGGGYGAALRGPLLRIDPRTGRVRARIELDGTAGHPVLGFGIQAAGRHVWIWGPRDILGVDARTRRVTRRIAIEDEHGEVTGFAAAAGRLVAATADGHLLCFEARTGRRTGVLAIAARRPSPRALAGSRLLFTATGAVGVVNLASGRLAWRRRLGFRAGASLAGDGLVWVHSAATHEPGDRVTALRLADGTVVTSGIVPAFGSTGIAAAAGRVAIATAGGALLVLTPFPA